MHRRQGVSFSLAGQTQITSSAAPQAGRFDFSTDTNTEMAYVKENASRAVSEAIATASVPPSASEKPRIEITPSATQYRQLCRDLAALRKAGAASNTAAILQAVHAAAMRPMLASDRANGRRRSNLAAGRPTGG